jgi:hypothetical protein
MSQVKHDMFLSSIRVLSDATYSLFASDDLKTMGNKVGFRYVTYKNTQSKTTNLKGNLFNQISTRFVTFDYKISTLDSSQYCISVFVNKNFRKAVVEGSQKSSMNVSSMRRLNITRREEFSAPGILSILFYLC